jgi:hypothetical protein
VFALGPLLCNVFINDICDSIHNFSHFLFADYLKIYRNIMNDHDCKHLQHYINPVHNWCLVNDMNLNLGKTTIMYFTRKTIFVYIISNVKIWWHAPRMLNISVYCRTASFIFTNISIAHFHKVSKC